MLGYHGCERDTAEKLLDGDEFIRSTKDFDWLGPGVYFWESDPDRAIEWANDGLAHRKFVKPYVVGAVIDLGNCLDLTTREGIQALEASFDSFAEGQRRGGLPLPTNENIRSDPYRDRLLRRLDCAVIRHLHQNIEDERSAWSSGGRIGDPPPDPFDTVRGMFPEGGEAFAGSCFLSKTHTQIAVRNDMCIKGVFRLRDHHPASPSIGGSGA